MVSNLVDNAIKFCGQYGKLTLTTKTGDKIKLDCAYSPRQIAILKAGGLLPYTKSAK